MDILGQAEIYSRKFTFSLAHLFVENDWHEMTLVETACRSIVAFNLNPNHEMPTFDTCHFGSDVRQIMYRFTIIF